MEPSSSVIFVVRLVLVTCSQGGEPLFEFSFCEPLTVDHYPGPFCHIPDVFKRICLHKEKIRPPACRYCSEFVFLMKEDRSRLVPARIAS